MKKKMTIAALSLAAAMLVLAGCGPTVCSGTSCACPAGETCAFDACGASTAGCRLDCGPNATCSGSCGANCQVTCGGKQCTHTVGAGSSVSCTTGTCNITCEGACTVAGDANLTCKGGTTQSIAGCS